MKVVGAGTSVYAWAKTVGLPCLRGPLKRVIGEEILIGFISGRRTTARPLPLPTIAPGQERRACGAVVASSFLLLHFGSPVVSTAPCLSNSMLIVSRTG